MADRIRMGNAALTRVVESQVDDLPVKLFPQTPTEAWRELADEFAPTFWNADGWRIVLQTWVIEVDGLTVLVDTGVGNDRDRPTMPPFDHLNTDFLGIAAARRGRPRGRRRRHQHSPPLRPRRLEHHAAGRRMGAHVSECPLSDDGTPTTGTSIPTTSLSVPRRAPRSDAARQAGALIVFEDSILPGRRADRAVVRRLSAQRVGAAATRTGPHAWLVGGVARRG